MTDVCSRSNELNILFYWYFKYSGIKDKENLLYFTLFYFLLYYKRNSEIVAEGQIVRLTCIELVNM